MELDLIPFILMLIGVGVCLGMVLVFASFVEHTYHMICHTYEYIEKLEKQEEEA